MTGVPSDLRPLGVTDPQVNPMPPPKDREYQRRWKAAHPDSVRRYKKLWRKRHPEAMRSERMRWARRHREDIKRRWRTWEHAHPRTCNPERLRAKAQRRRARKYGNGPVERIDRFGLWKRDRGLCGICGRAIPRDESSIDHIIPLARGGTHTWNNVQLAHLRCNQIKGVR